MPFKSLSQRRRFQELKEQGKMSQETIDKWEKETPAGKLPERVKWQKMPKAPKWPKAPK